MGKLTAVFVKKLETSGMYADGDGLYLQVSKSLTKSWIYRYRAPITQRERQMGLGAFPEVSLASARELRDAAKAQRKQGIDPIEDRKRRRIELVGGIRLSEVIDLYLKAHAASWSNDKHIYQWNRTLQLACEAMQDPPVNIIETAHVLKAIEPIWLSKNETASRTRQRLEKVLDYAKVRGFRDGENPARWKGNLQALLPSPESVTSVEHMAALPYSDIPLFIDDLKARPHLGAKAMLWTILTVVRTGSTIGATRNEIVGNAWELSPERMKMKRGHRVPLSTQALALMNDLPVVDGDSTWLFPGTRPGKHMSNMTMLKYLKLDMGYPNLTVHGFRSTFRDWGAEVRDYPEHLLDACMAHQKKDKVLAAYQRGDLFEKRRVIMQDWADYCFSSGSGQ